MKTVIIGLDAFDPVLFEKLQQEGKLPHLGAFLEKGWYSRFQVSNPPQSEVSWTSIATGLNPGEHGMFDFVHRDPETYSLQVSLLPKSKNFGGTTFVRPSNSRTIFDVAADRGFPSTSLWWPATFPARPESPVQTLPGLGTPDIQGRLGVGSYYSSNSDLPSKQGKTPVFHLKMNGKMRYSGEIEGPQIKTKYGAKNSVVPLEIIVIDDQTADLKIGGVIQRLFLGEWSPILELSFKASWLGSVHAITRVILTSLQPSLNIYFLPLQIHPVHPIWRYGTPASFVKDAWKTCGPFLTLGWPQDTTGLEDKCINDDQFLKLCDSIFQTRTNLLFHHLEKFQEGLLASVFDSLDRIQHMFWKTRPDVVETWYKKYDQLVGDVLNKLSEKPGKNIQLIVVSDHGFNNLNFKVNLNQWLMDKGYLSGNNFDGARDWKSINWAQTKAYAIGLNSLYLNIRGRERDGIVDPSERDILVKQISKDLIEWLGPDNKPIIWNAWSNEQAFSGALSAQGPDILVGYAPGFRASSETGLGGWRSASIEENLDHWEADHCFDSIAVPGILFSLKDMENFPNPSYRDIPALAIHASPDSSRSTSPRKLAAENQDEVEERLRSLGYL